MKRKSTAAGLAGILLAALFSFAVFAAGAPFAAAAESAAMPARGTTVPILLDTDIGSDIDDAFAVALIVRSPELELLGVTTVSGDAPLRARLAAKLLAAAGAAWRDVPVYAGESGPAQKIPQGPWARGFSSRALHLHGGVEFMRRTIERRPGLTIVALGELTDVAAVLRSDPALKSKIRQIVLMGGSVRRGYEEGSAPQPEWNIRSNPQAAQAVFRSGIPLLVAPLDVTAMLSLDAAGRERIFRQQEPLAEALRSLYRLWGGRNPTLFDPMAVAMLLQPDLCRSERLAIDVDAKGMTLVVPGAPPNALVGLKADPAAFFAFYLGRVAPGPGSD